MATLTVLNIASTGTAITTASAAEAGDVFANNAGDVFFQVTNGSGGSIDVTFTAQNTSFTNPDLGAITMDNIVVSVANGATKMIGPFAPKVFNNSSQQVAVGYSEHTSVTVAAIRFRAHGI